MALCKYWDWSRASVGTVYGFTPAIGSFRSIIILLLKSMSYLQRSPFKKNVSLYYIVTNNDQKSTKSGAKVKKIFFSFALTANFLVD